MRLKISEFLVVLVIVGSLIVGGCSTQQVASNASPPDSTATEASTKTTTETTTSVSEVTKEAVPGMNNLPRLEGKATVEMIVNGSPITIEVDGTNAPITAGNFVDLVKRGVYDGVAFHRVIGPQSNPPQDPFVAQGGDPQSKDPKVPAQRLGTGNFVDPKTGSPRYIPLEIKPKGAKEPIYGKTITEAPELPHKLGAIAMARSQVPNSASSQFYFALADLSFLDGNYAVFGKVTNGMEVVSQIKQGDRIESAKVTQGGENLKNGGQ
ncbi:peptidylprolyl isomerase [Chlorogloeopsis fritschii PCC 9212]|uniref:Peptidyl-prolyl cis-trans isomerase n=1 Tax=Chlorogloeopsis fritschii PCC 6912 TaxID=211165 RepID=A0A3S1FDX3_CHLFR|nr:peptidylprolyl isomerase [Chlorogloeopsis fritschii]RUR76243.1 hypothetical protein PCC6912_44150 [Chlorogloeopsis fritschii PCC 6912]